MTVETPSAVQPRSAASFRSALGIVLLLPAAALCALTQLWPTMGTLAMSFQDIQVIGGDTTWVGTDNYGALFERGPLSGAFLFAAALAFTRVLAVAVVPPALGWAIARLRGGPATLARGLATLPMIVYLPGAFGLAWFLTLIGLQASLGRVPVLTDPTLAPLFLVVIDGLAALAFGATAGVVLFGAAARSRQPGKWMLTAWLALVVTAAALGWQVVDLPLVLTGGGPASATMTPVYVAYRLFAQNQQFGPGAAVVTLTLIPVLGLGLLAGIGLAILRPGLTLGEKDAEAKPSSGLAVVVSIGASLIVAIAVLTLVVIYLVPLGAGGASRPLLERYADGGLAIWSDSWLSPLGGVAVNLLVAVLGAYAIGVLRPLGRQSLWLLVPFAPWFFVGPDLHAFDWILIDRSLGVLGTWVALIPPGLSTGVLALLAVAFFGGSEAPSARLGPWVVAAAAGSVWLLSAIYDVFWQLMVGGPRTTTLLTAAIGAVQSRQGVDPGFWLALWAPALVLGVLLIGLVVAFGGRLRFAEDSNLGPVRSTRDSRDS